MQSTSKLPIVGMDIAKNIFQVHTVDPETGEIGRHKLRRDKIGTFFVNYQPSLIAMEACGGAHHWARTLQDMGHQVKLMHAKHVRPFVQRDKTDARDAQAIWVAAGMAHILTVPVKSEQQQECLAMHRMRELLMKTRIMCTNQLRGLLSEFGLVLPEGHQQLMTGVPIELAKAQEQGKFSDVFVQCVQELIQRVHSLQVEIDKLGKRLAALSKQNQQMKALLDVPGIGPLTATALVSTATDLSSFKSGSQFSAWLGLTPKQTGTGGKTRQLGLSKRGDTYVRTMLMHGARAVIAQSGRNGDEKGWIQRLLQRRPYNVVVAALANKIARVAWAVLSKGHVFDMSKWNPTQAATA
jgi:transposase